MDSLISQQYVDLFGLWLFCLTMVCFVAPIQGCFEWRRRQSSDGYSSVGLIFCIAAMSLWLYYGKLKTDGGAMMVNGIGLSLHVFYTLCYDYYLTDKKHLHYQLASAAVFITSVFIYVWDLPDDKALIIMGRICTTVQSSGCLLGFYGLYYIFNIKTTEYMPFGMTAYGAFVCLNALIFSLLIKDIYMIISNLSGAVMTGITFSMYFVYPPQTWLLPWHRFRQKKEQKQS